MSADIALAQPASGKAVPADGGACGRPAGIGLTEDYPQSSCGK